MKRVFFLLLLIPSPVLAACETGYFPTVDGNTTRKYIVCDTAAEIPSSGLSVGDLVWATDQNRFYAATSSTEVTTIGTKPTAADMVRLSTAVGVSGWTPINDCNTATSAVTYDTATHAWGCNSITGGAGAWGDITGTLANQTDLQTALDGKADDLGADDNYVTDAQLVVIGNTSGTNTGDQTTVSGNAGTATALAANPADCATSTHFAVGVDAGGVAVCEAIADADVPNDITITETDPQVGTLTNTKWCTTDGTDIDCTSDAPAGSGDVTDVFSCASGDCSSITVADGDLLNMSGINASGTAEGLILPQGASTTSATAEGQLSWDTDGDYLTVGTGSSYRTIGGDSFRYNNSRLCTSTVTADAGTALTSTDCDAYALNSDNATSTSRTFCLSAGFGGQRITLFHVAGATNEIELGDGAAGACAGATGAATILAGVWPAATNQQNDVITLVYRSSDSSWVEVGRAAN